MIKKVFKSPTDVDNLSQKHIVLDMGLKTNYKNIVVNKPWGYEYLIFENCHVAIWVLFLKKHSKTSMHCHPGKKTSLVVLEGNAVTSFLEQDIVLSVLDGVVIDKAVFHSTYTDHDGGSFVMEIETPPDKADLVRLKDEYGRENKGYEGGSDLSRDLDKYEHHYFDHDHINERIVLEKVIKESKIMIHVYEDWVNLQNEITNKGSCIISFLDTSIVNNSGEVILGVGEICDGNWLLGHFSNFRPSMNIFTVLTIH